LRARIVNIFCALKISELGVNAQQFALYNFTTVPARKLFYVSRIARTEICSAAQSKMANGLPPHRFDRRAGPRL
jgi:hypothetical protein